MFSGGLFSLISYFLETKWKGFQSLIWVYKTIIPIGGKVNAIIFRLWHLIQGYDAGEDKCGGVKSKVSSFTGGQVEILAIGGLNQGLAALP